MLDLSLCSIQKDTRLDNKASEIYKIPPELTLRGTTSMLAFSSQLWMITSTSSFFGENSVDCISSSLSLYAGVTN